MDREAVEQIVTGEQPVAWPPRGDTPLNEFHSEGYITPAFQTLFPTGAADFTAPCMRPCYPWLLPQASDDVQ